MLVSIFLLITIRRNILKQTEAEIKKMDAEIKKEIDDGIISSPDGTNNRQ